MNLAKQDLENFFLVTKENALTLRKKLRKMENKEDDGCSKITGTASSDIRQIRSRKAKVAWNRIKQS